MHLDSEQAPARRRCLRPTNPRWTWLSCAMLVVATEGCSAQSPLAPDTNAAVIQSATDVATGNGSAQLFADAERLTSLRNREGEDWASFLGPRGDGTSSERGVAPENWSPAPPLVWQMKLGVGYAAPAIAEQRLYQFDRFGNDERLTCFDAYSAKEIWRHATTVDYDDMYGYNNGPRCSPVVDESRVYTYGVAGQLNCVDAGTGELIWSKDTVDEYSVVQNFFGVASSPVVFNDLLLVMVGGSTPESLQLPPGRLADVRPAGSAVVAFDKRTGQEVYRVGNDLASYASLAVQELHGKPTGLAFLRGGLFGWEPQTGAPLFDYPWRAEILESVNAAMPVVADNQILVSEAYEIGSALLQVDPSAAGGFSIDEVRADAGRRSQQSFRAHWSTPVLIDGYLYGCSGRNQPDSDFRCVRLSDGEVQWADRRHERSSVLAIDGYLIVLGEYGRLELIRPTPDKLEVLKEIDFSDSVSITAANGEAVPVQLAYPCWAAPILSHGLLYVRDQDQLLCFDLFAN